MTKRKFLKEYRCLIDETINRAWKGREARLNDTERWLWVMNDYSLYTLAKVKGVRL